MDEQGGMCKAMREIQEDFAEKDRLISRYQQEISSYQQENLRLRKLLRERGVEF